jgi:AraC family transcriptional regulator of adaptative response/methylated-DNA-[protein]-cysteine methyltransferase
MSLVKKSNGQIQGTANAQGGTPLSPLVFECCEIPYGFAFISCSATGIRRLDLFENKRQLQRYLLAHSPQSPAQLSPCKAEQTALLEHVRRALLNHISLEELPVDLSGTPFQLRVWKHLRSIPPGEVRSYAEVARALGFPRAVRAVASACARNILGLVIPCHRVIRSDGSPGGYRWGLPLKEKLLLLERQQLQKALVSTQQVR